MNSKGSFVFLRVMSVIFMLVITLAVFSMVYPSLKDFNVGDLEKTKCDRFDIERNLCSHSRLDCAEECIMLGGEFVDYKSSSLFTNEECWCKKDNNPMRIY